MKYIVLGAGKQGTAIVSDLLQFNPERNVLVIDSDARAVNALRDRCGNGRAAFLQADIRGTDSIVREIESGDCVVSAVPYFFNLDLSKMAVRKGAHFCDLGGNTDIVNQQLSLDAEARSQGVFLIPDCGLSPGMTNVLAAHAISKLSRTDTLEMRVGGLPLNPVPPLNYQLVFSVHGLLNEYIEPAIIVENGREIRVPSMTGVESLSFEGFPNLEAFYTFGGLSTLADSFGGRVPNMNEKTVRYPGHAAVVGALLGDPRFPTREAIAQHLEATLPKEGADIVLARVSAIGDGCYDCELVDRYDPQTGLTAMMRTTGFSAAIVAQMMAGGRLSPPGAHVQEKIIPSAEFIAELARRNIVVREHFTAKMPG